MRIVEGADDICAACPHMENDDCQRFGKSALEMDAKLKQTLGLTEDMVEPWFMLVDSVRDAITPDNLYQFCGHCNWKNLNYCTDGIAALRAGDRDD